MARPPTGIRTRHARSCPANDGASCKCSPSYEAWAWSQREQKKLRRTFSNLSEAKNWRADASGAIRKGTMRSPSRVTLREAAEAWLEGARDCSIPTRAGDAFKPSVIRGYETSLTVNRKDADGESLSSILDEAAHA